MPVDPRHDFAAEGDELAVGQCVLGTVDLLVQDLGVLKPVCAVATDRGHMVEAGIVRVKMPTCQSAAIVLPREKGVDAGVRDLPIERVAVATSMHPIKEPRQVSQHVDTHRLAVVGTGDKFLVGIGSMAQELPFIQDASEGRAIEQRDGFMDPAEDGDRFLIATYRMIGRARDLTHRSQLPLGGACAAAFNDRMPRVAKVVQFVGGGLG